MNEEQPKNLNEQDEHAPDVEALDAHDESQEQGDVEVPPEPEPTAEQDAQLESELAVAERDTSGRDLRGDHRARLEAIKHSLDATLGEFENTSDNHDGDAARETVNSVRERLDAVRTEVADAISALD